MIFAFAPSYWQQVFFGLLVSIPILLIGSVLLGWSKRSVLEPRAAGRRWPEGARGIRPIVEVIVDIQRRPASRDAAAGDTVLWTQAVRFGSLVAVCAVVPFSTGLVVSQAGLGLYVLAVSLGADAWLRGRGSGVGESRDALRTSIALAVVIGLMGGVVHAQWGTASLASIVTAQANAAVGGNAMWGLPTMFAHPVVFAVAWLAGYVTIIEIGRAPATAQGGLVGVVTKVVNDGWTVVFSAWMVAAFAGGGAVPWPIDNPGVRHVVSVALFSLKTVLAVAIFAWATATWPTVSSRTVRLLVGVGMIVGLSGIASTLAIRSFV